MKYLRHLFIILCSPDLQVSLLRFPHTVATWLVSVIQDVYIACGVCPNDPLVFTCEVNDAVLLQVALPTGHHWHITFGVRARPETTCRFFCRLFSYSTLALSIENASLLDGGKITCDDTRAMAGCPRKVSLLQKNSIHHDKNVYRSTIIGIVPLKTPAMYMQKDSLLRLHYSNSSTFFRAPSSSLKFVCA